MPKVDSFTLSLRTDLKGNHVTLETAASLAKKSFRQFTRELRGETKQGLMPIETLAELKKEGVITENTVDQWFVNMRQKYRLKK